MGKGKRAERQRRGFVKSLLREQEGQTLDYRTKRARIAAHDALDPLWRAEGATLRRGEVYRRMAFLMNLPQELAHISMFDIDQCKEVVRLIHAGRFTDPAWEKGW